MRSTRRTAEAQGRPRGGDPGVADRWDRGLADVGDIALRRRNAVTYGGPGHRPPAKRHRAGDNQREQLPPPRPPLRVLATVNR